MSEGHPEADAKMVDVTAKGATTREATASCLVKMSATTRDLVARRELPKGDALEVARIAGIMGAKKTSELIPLCHPIAIGAVTIDLEPVEAGIEITAFVRTHERTGVEMEAMTAATVAALTVYDMVKGTERGVEVDEVRLLTKSGGRSGDWTRD
jgi:cyclic pyranopterin phosphate synthase